MSKLPVQIYTQKIAKFKQITKTYQFIFEIPPHNITVTSKPVKYMEV